MTSVDSDITCKKPNLTGNVSLINKGEKEIKRPMLSSLAGRQVYF